MIKVPKNFQNILVVRTDRIGDVVLTTPVLKVLSQSYPGARISVLITPTTLDLVQGNPYVDQVLIDERMTRHRGLLGCIRLVRDLRQKNFDLAIILHTKRRYNFVCFLAGIPLRTGYKNNKFGFLLTHPIKDVRPQGARHEAQYCLDVLNTMGIKTDQADLFVPTQKEAELWAVQWMREKNIPSNTMILIHPGASDQTKCWPAVNFARLMDHLIERYALKVVLIGTSQTSPIVAEILSQARYKSELINLTGQTSLAQTISLLRRARLLISNDSGPVHVAAGVGTAVISLFLRHQPGINPERWRPLGPRSFTLVNKLGEEVLLGPKGQVASGNQASISVDHVLELVEKIFQQDNQSIFHW